MKPFLICSVASLLLLAACKKEPNIVTTDCGTYTIDLIGDFDDDTQELAEHRGIIDNLISNTACSRGNDCRAMAIGAKPCGGPTEYIVYNQNNVHENPLEEAVCYYTAYMKAYNAEYGLVSTCELTAEPEFDCVDGDCKVVE